MAVMVSLPTTSEEVAHVACALPFNAAVPQPVIVVPPTWKFTVPAGVPEPGAVTLTVAVNVTDGPETDGLGEEVTAVPVEALFTGWMNIREGLDFKVRVTL